MRVFVSEIRHALLECCSLATATAAAAAACSRTSPPSRYFSRRHEKKKSLSSLCRMVRSNSLPSQTFFLLDASRVWLFRAEQCLVAGYANRLNRSGCHFSTILLGMVCTVSISWCNACPWGLEKCIMQETRRPTATVKEGQNVYSRRHGSTVVACWT